MKKETSDAIRYLLDNHGHETYNDFLNCITKKSIAELMVGYAKLKGYKKPSTLKSMIDKQMK